jgi:hypothetical protein
MFGSTKKNNAAIAEGVVTNPVIPTSTALKASIVVEGFLTKLGVTRNELLKESWTRRYFTLNMAGEIFYYKSKADYKEDSVQNRVKVRPIDIHEYFVHSDNYAEKSGTGDDGGGEQLYQFSLVPKDGAEFRHFIMRCDTEDILEMWLDAFRTVCPDNCAAIAK